MDGTKDHSAEQNKLVRKTKTAFSPSFVQARFSIQEDKKIDVVLFGKKMETRRTIVTGGKG